MIQPTTIGNMKVSQAMPLMQIAASQWNKRYPTGTQLNLSNVHHWNVVKRIVNYSLINN